MDKELRKIKEEVKHGKKKMAVRELGKAIKEDKKLDREREMLKKKVKAKR